MKIIEVTTPAHIKAFHAFQRKIYKNDPNWIPPLKQDVEAVFTKKENKFFRHGEASRWLFESESGEVVARVATFIDKKKGMGFKQPTGGMGFFECIDDKATAFKVFDHCKQWLEERGMEAMDGPINFGENDRFWGLITSNFDAPPYYKQNYNPEYYVAFFKEYGFEVYYNQHIFWRTADDPLQEKYNLRADRILKNPKYTFKCINKKDLAQAAEDFRTVYNRAWVTHDSFKGMAKAQAMAIMKQMEPIIDKRLIIFAYYEDQPVGFYINLPEMNQIFKHVNGNLNWWGKIVTMVRLKVLRSLDTSFAIAFGIDPDHQGRGVEGAIFRKFQAEILKKPKTYQKIIITWIGDFNPKMIRIIEGLNAKEFRKMATFRYLFDRSKPFERSPIIGAKKKVENKS